MLDFQFKQYTDGMQTGAQLHELAVQLYPICRSITGQGVRQSLALIRKIVPIQIVEVVSGEQVFDWQVPDEWNIYDAYIDDPQGRRIVDFKQHNLHVVSYSTAVDTRLSLSELKPHLFSLPEQPELIPYRTSYYQKSWGFCLSHKQLTSLTEGDYQVCINSTLQPGSLSYGELLIPGASQEEVLISCHICHPSLANDNLSGITVAAHLAKFLMTQSLRYSYRFLFIPGTIGAITWLAKNESQSKNIKHGLVLAGLGDSGHLSYKKSRRGDSEIDQVAAYVLQQQGKHELFEFSPYGYDERQYCSPGFNLAVGRLSRSPHGTFPEYHTSADNLDFISPSQLEASLQSCVTIIDVLEHNRWYLNTQPKCEPRLSKYGLYSATGGFQATPDNQMALLWLLNLSDGKHSLLDIAKSADLPFSLLADAARVLQQHGLLVEFQHNKDSQ